MCYLFHIESENKVQHNEVLYRPLCILIESLLECRHMHRLTHVKLAQVCRQRQSPFHCNYKLFPRTIRCNRYLFSSSSFLWRLRFATALPFHVPPRLVGVAFSDDVLLFSDNTCRIGRFVFLVLLYGLPCGCLPAIPTTEGRFSTCLRIDVISTISNHHTHTQRKLKQLYIFFQGNMQNFLRAIFDIHFFCDI